MWNYVFYLIYLNEVEEKDYTSLDMYVAKLVSQQKPNLFVMELCLEMQ